MKKNLLSVGVAIILIILLACLTGCVNNTSSNIVKDLNDTINEEIAKWQEREYGATLSVYYIQNSLDKKELGYVIVASGDKEFTSKPDFTEYKENDITNYTGNSYDNMRMMLSEQTVNYIIGYDKNLQKYYNIEVTYDKVNLNGAEKEYPVFSNAKELK
ncbi:MAG: hypothetical protein J6J60_04040 [Clostridia bacterium]|nr:hypothetical protein [Clostridia bacterium]MBP3596553.1 hypothetical protein [Clostridia bacterium]